MAFDRVRGEIVAYAGYVNTPGEPSGGSPRLTWVLRPPCIPNVTQQPTDQALCVGSDTSFTVVATGDAPRSYQWRKDGIELNDEPNHFSGATESTLVVMNVTLADAGNYDCIVSNPCGSATSEPGTLSVCDLVSDLNCDGEVSLTDLAVLLSNFGRSDAPQRTEGDLNADGEVGLADLSVLLSAFGTACP